MFYCENIQLDSTSINFVRNPKTKIYTNHGFLGSSPENQNFAPEIEILVVIRDRPYIT